MKPTKGASYLERYSKVSILILNWNGGRDTIECLESLFQITYPNFQVIVVDNGSSDGSVDKIKEWAEGKIVVESKYFKFNAHNKPISKDRFILIPLRENLGFARGNNVGIRYALAQQDTEYVLTLNNDTVVDSDFLQPMLEIFKKEPEAGLAGPKILDYNRGRHEQGPAQGRINFLTILMFFSPLKLFFLRTPIAKLSLLVLLTHKLDKWHLKIWCDFPLPIPPHYRFSTG